MGMSDLSNAIKDVLGERSRQISVENYSTNHDDQYQNNELVRAASGYVDHVFSRGWTYSDLGSEVYQKEDVPEFWPWNEQHWKPKSPREDLVRAAALLIAEIERIDRKEAEGG